MHDNFRVHDAAQCVSFHLGLRRHSIGVFSPVFEVLHEGGNFVAALDKLNDIKGARSSLQARDGDDISFPG